MTVLSPEQQEDAAYVASLETEGEILQLDLTDERQYRHVVAMHTLLGQTPETRPGLHAGLAAAHDAGRPPEPLVADPPPVGMWLSGPVVGDVSVRQGTPYAAGTGYAAFAGGASAVNVSYWITAQSDPSRFLAAGMASDMGNGTYVPVVAEPLPPQPAPPTMTGTVLVSYRLHPDSPWQSQRVSRNVDVGAAGDPVVTAPVQKPAHVTNPTIKIAIGRGLGPADDVDYWLAFDPNQTYYYVPFTGYVDFTFQLPNPLPRAAVNIFGRLARWTPGGQGGYYDLGQAEQDHIFSKLSVSGTRLIWNLQPPPVPGQHGDPINFGLLNWASGEKDYLTIQFQVAAGTNFGVATVQSADQPDADPLDGTANIKPLTFLYSCVAAGTPILMADGSEAAIETVESGMTVRAADGSDREVVASHFGRHRGAALRLSYGNRQIQLSHNHVVMTPHGPEFAHQLEVGATLCGPDGTTVELTTKDEIEFDGQLWNLSLAPEEAEPDPAAYTLVAAGLAVCDYQVQIHLETTYRMSKENVLARLNPADHQDYLNLLEERAAVKV